jgi:hypothetical protein
MLDLRHHFKPKLLLFGYSFGIHCCHFRDMSLFWRPSTKEKTPIMNLCLWWSSYNNQHYARNKWLVVFLRTFVRGRPPTVAPRSISLFLCNKFRLRHERKPLAEGPKKHLPFTRIVNHSESWDPPLSGALCIYTEACAMNIFRAI